MTVQQIKRELETVRKKVYMSKGNGIAEEILQLLIEYEEMDGYETNREDARLIAQMAAEDLL